MFNRSTILLFLFGCFVFLAVDTFYEVYQTLSWGAWAFRNKVAIDELLFRFSSLLVVPFGFLADYALTANHIYVQGTFQVWYRSLTTLNAWMFAVSVCYWAQPDDMWQAVATVLLIHVIVGVSSIYVAAVVYTRTRPTYLFGRFRV